MLTRLRRGAYVVDDEIDLHGMTGAEAKAALRKFIAECVDRRLRCVRVVHGKGRRSGPRGPVLKHVVNHWLQRADDVLDNNGGLDALRAQVAQLHDKYLGLARAAAGRVPPRLNNLQ